MTIPELHLAGLTVTAAAPLGEPIAARNVADQGVQRVGAAGPPGAYGPRQGRPRAG
ncbi:MAG: hypothetical protein H7233_02505, partial [Pseudorhodobacter sp.]|nr:hypothetical protein [Frankiaceae bacterium]